MGRIRTYGHLGTLTTRERDVFDLVREGLTNPQIADRLDMSLETVKHHVSQILSKLGVSTREEAAAWEPRREGSLGRIVLAIAGLAIVAGAVAGLALLAWGLSQSGTADQLTSLAGILPGPVYYLPPDDGSPWISTPDLLGQASIDVVDSPDQLKTEAVDPIAVIIDKEWWGRVDQGWLAAQESDGVIVVGGRIDIAELGDSWSSQFRNFYTFRYRCADRLGSGQDYLDTSHARDQFRFMLHRIALIAETSPCLLASPTPSPVTQARN